MVDEYAYSLWESRVKTISLTRGKVALVDDDDFTRLSLLKWQSHFDGFHWYARHSYTKHTVNKKIPMHRFITEAKNGSVVDHVNGDGLDNRSINLRICSHAENMLNTRKHSGSSIYKGVSWFSPSKKWRARITFRGNATALGYFDSEIEAAKTYEEKAKELFGEFYCPQNMKAAFAK